MNEEKDIQKKEEIKELLLNYSKDKYTKKIKDIEDGFYSTEIDVSISKRELLKMIVYMEIMHRGTEEEKEICRKLVIKDIMFSDNDSLAHVTFEETPWSDIASYKLHANMLSKESYHRIYVRKYKIGNEFYLIGIKSAFKNLDIKKIIKHILINPFIDLEKETVDIDQIINLLNKLGIETISDDQSIKLIKDEVETNQIIDLFK